MWWEIKLKGSAMQYAHRMIYLHQSWSMLPLPHLPVTFPFHDILKTMFRNQINTKYLEPQRGIFIPPAKTTWVNLACKKNITNLSVNTLWWRQPCPFPKISYELIYRFWRHIERAFVGFLNSHCSYVIFNSLKKINKYVKAREMISNKR